MIRRPPRSTLDRSSAASDVYKRQHQLDVGGEPVAEAAGFEAVLAGAHQRLDEDDALLAEMSKMLDSLYAVSYTHLTLPTSDLV